MSKIMLAAVGLLAAAVLTYWLTAAPASEVQAFVGATLFDGVHREPVKDAVVLIEGGRILAAGPADRVKIPWRAQRLEVTGKFIIPGLADLHTHLRSGLTLGYEDHRKHLMQTLGWGITTVLVPAIDPATFRALKDESRPAASPYSRFVSTGPVFRTNAGSGPDFTPATIDEARARVKELKAMKVDAVKLVYDDMSWLVATPQPLLPQEIVLAIIDQAHREGLRVFVHAPIIEYAKEALRMGADALLHSVLSAPADDELIRLMKDRHAFYVPTLSLFEACADLGGWIRREALADSESLDMMPPATYAASGSDENVRRIESERANRQSVHDQLDIARSNLVKIFSAGIPVVAGSDTGLFGVVRGVASHMELRLMVEAGMPAVDVLQSATLVAARALQRETDSGSVEAGKLADLLVLNADPLADIANTARVHFVVKGGRVNRPADLFNQAEQLPLLFPDS